MDIREHAPFFAPRPRAYTKIAIFVLQNVPIQLSKDGEDFPTDSSWLTNVKIGVDGAKKEEITQLLEKHKKSNQTSFSFLSDKCELTAGSDEKHTAQPRRGSNSGLPIAGRTL